MKMANSKDIYVTSNDISFFRKMANFRLYICHIFLIYSFINIYSYCFCFFIVINSASKTWTYTLLVFILTSFHKSTEKYKLNCELSSFSRNNGYLLKTILKIVDEAI